MAAAMKLVVGGFLSAVVDGAATKAVACLESNYGMPERAKELLRELETRLTVVKAVSEAADNRLITNTNLVQWLKRLHAAAQEAENALDEFEVEEASITGKRKVSELMVSSLRSLKSLVIPDNGMGRLEHVVRTLAQLCESSATFVELLKMDDSKANQQLAGVVRESSSHLPVDVEVFGRDEVKELILKVIIGSSWHDHAGSDSGTGKIRAARHNILVLPIVGMSGMGKTILAQVIYNHAKVKEHFQHRAWVYVSEHFSFKRTLQEILRSFNGYENMDLDSGDSMEVTITKLRSKLCGNRFFLVLDNVWAEMCQEWSTLLTALSDEARQHGSVLLVTTQSQRVAQIVATICPVYLKALPWESFWPLFQYHAFGGVEVAQKEDNQNMLLIGEEIAKKLDGMPLAAKVIGNLLRCRFSWDNWRRVANSDWWNLGEALQGILPYLRVSYQHLSPKERQCFAFCSIFPRNYLFDKDRLVQMWIAHDFIQSNDVPDGMRLEDVGRQCFDDLLDRSLFQPTFVSNKYVMHDLVHGLAIVISLHQCFLHGERSGGASSSAPENVRHLALQIGSLEQCQELHKYRNLRTLLLFGRFESDATFSLLDGVLGNSPGLRVLDLSYVEAPGKGWPSDARGLRKLRFLDLSFTRIARFKDLPSNLQVLHLRGYDADCLPQSITKLTNLRHLYVDDSALSKIQGIGRLTELQELDSFIVRKGQGFMIRELKNMRELTVRLCIRGIENVRSKEEAMEARLMDKKHLGALVIEGRKVPKFALEGLQPHRNIQELTIKFYQDQVFPHWVLQPDNLANLLHINLESCRLLSTLPTLGHLPMLKLLSLRKLPSVKHIDGTSFGCFPSLQELEFHWVEQLEEWTEPDAAAAAELHAHGSSLFLRCLKKLHLESCPSLRQLPQLPYLSALKELKISKPGSYVLALPTCTQVLEYLTTLKIEYCHHSVVLSAHQFKSLENLELIKCEGVRLADGFQCFGNLRSARVESCPQLLSATAAFVSTGLGQESHEKKQQQEQDANLLTNLRTDDSLMTGDYFRAMGNLPSLHNLLFFDIPNLTHFSEEQELWFQQLTSLECLSIVSCYALQRLPSSLAAIPSIKTLGLFSLHNLHSLPDDALPPTLQELHISHCTGDLNIRVSKDGADWPKVVHVPYIKVDGTVIQNI
ncbi:putative disease resistance protein RGA1 [Phragmites australis]|uniref:putative disease resistance protein RGA1 n=1 Tax=Phragmites australis TaxID=29695 RepID=UPI002D79FF37|nr:putative disease resistance protein RGA1 [Phragmites australis]